MNYRGSFDCFDFSKIKTFPLAERKNKVTLADLVEPDKLTTPPALVRDVMIDAAARAIVYARPNGRQVLAFIGAHPVKLGLSPIIIRMMELGLISHLAGNGATAIHDFELALIGQTSENVPNALPEGKFGMADETGRLINRALTEGAKRGLGFGESLGRLILGEPMPERVEFKHADKSILAAGVRLKIPVTIHAGIGTDIIDQHPDFDGAAKGAASGFDFGIYAATICKFTHGGVILNFGSAVTGPEVLLKAVSMAANIGKPPAGITAFDFDLRPVEQADVNDESKPTYYFRDNKSIVNRIPAAFAGHGYYIEGDFRETLPALYVKIMEIS